MYEASLHSFNFLYIRKIPIINKLLEKKSKNTDNKGKRGKKGEGIKARKRRKERKSRKRRKFPLFARLITARLRFLLCRLPYTHWRADCLQLTRVEATQTSRQKHLSVGPQQKAEQVLPCKKHHIGDTENLYMDYYNFPKERIYELTEAR